MILGDIVSSPLCDWKRLEIKRDCRFMLDAFRKDSSGDTSFVLEVIPLLRTGDRDSEASSTGLLMQGFEVDFVSCSNVAPLWFQSAH